MNVSADFTTSQNPKIVRIQPSEATGPHTMFATEQRWCGVVTTNKERRISTSRERAAVRDILTQIAQTETVGSVVGTKKIKESGAKRFWLTVLPV